MDEARRFLAHLMHKAPPSAHITLTAIHPDNKHPTPSRHIPVHNHTQLEKGLSDLLQANALGWGAYVGMGYRRGGLGRWRRGGNADVLALPALFADVDDAQALPRLRTFSPSPSWIVGSGGGYHLYWWLDAPLTDLTLGTHLLKSIAQALNGDKLTISQSLRLVTSRNTKPHRNGALCRVIEANDTRYNLYAFERWLPRHYQRAPPRKRTYPKQLNPHLIQAVTHRLMRDYGARPSTDGWLASRCPLHHQHDTVGAHFAFKPDIGCGVCHGKHGTLRLDALCSVLNLEPQDYGGIYAQEKA
jgi:hypothetical protein